MKKLTEFLKLSYHEMRYNVTFPEYKVLQESALLVLLASFIFSVVIGLVDYGFKEALDIFYSLF